MHLSRQNLRQQAQTYAQSGRFPEACQQIFDRHGDNIDILPDHSVIRRNALVSLEYDPLISDAERLSKARAWCEWAISQAGGLRARPNLSPVENRPLRFDAIAGLGIDGV